MEALMHRSYVLVMCVCTPLRPFQLGPAPAPAQQEHVGWMVIAYVSISKLRSITCSCRSMWIQIQSLTARNGLVVPHACIAKGEVVHAALAARSSPKCLENDLREAQQW
jgi:hypothetical protein